MLVYIGTYTTIAPWRVGVMQPDYIAVVVQYRSLAVVAV